MSIKDVTRGRTPRLSEKVDQATALLPWRRAHQLTRCFLYWIPASSFPMPAAQRDWLIEFLERFAKVLETKYGHRREVFLQFKTAMDDRDQFQSLAPKFSPLLGLSRQPGDKIPDLPTKEDMMPVVRGEKEFNLKDWIADYCYWFVCKKPIEQMKAWFGRGGVTIIFLKPDPKTVPVKLPFTQAFREKNPVFKVIDVDALVAGAFAMKDDFLQKSKQLFGEALESNPQYPGILFILPLLRTAHLFEQPEEYCEKCFQLFDIYVNESSADKGILLAFKNDYEEALIGVLEEMRKGSLVYPGA